MRAALAVFAIGIGPLCAGAQALPSFEVATIKPVARCTAPIVATFSQSGRLSVGCQPLVILIRLAYFPRVQEGDVTGGPKWSQTELYDLVAKVDDADMAGWSRMSYREQLKVVQPMLRQLLADRFNLKTHTNTRTTRTYALVQAKGGAKLKDVSPPDQQDRIVGDAAPKSTDPPVGGFRIVNNRMIARAVQIPNLLWFFAGRSGYEDAPAVDRTGLNGYYDFEMRLPDFNDKAEFERQMKQQLGLRIEQQKISLPTIVIDEAEKPSLDN